MTYGQILKSARIRRELTLEQVAKAISSHKGYVCGIENGKVNPPSPRFTVKFCRVLGLEPEYMLCLAVAEKAPRIVRQGFIDYVHTRFVALPEVEREEKDAATIRMDRPKLVI